MYTSPSSRRRFVASPAIAATFALAFSVAPFVRGQTTDPGAASPPTAQQAPAQQAPAQQAPAATDAPVASATLSNTPAGKKAKVAKDDKVKQGRDTRAALKRDKKLDPLAGKDAQLPDKQLYDKALAQSNSGHYDVARLDLQTLLNTYPDSQYQMRSKLAVADSWYKEGGSAALAQAEQEYKDFITFFPNVPEAAEAQMRVGDIYFKQMDVPDRDYAKGVHAEEEYRTMLKQYPDAAPQLLKDCKQKLREVQELLATREAELAAFYATHANWPATIARYKTVIDTYPQYSHMDDALIGYGDAYAAESEIVKKQNLPEAARARLLQEYDGKAIDAYRQVVLYHYAAPHVEDAKERLAAMNVPIPRPRPEDVAASEELEGSRAQYNLRRRLELLVLRRPDTVTAAGSGDPTLVDPPPTVAPTITRALLADYRAALDPSAARAVATAPAADAARAPAAGSVDSAPAPSATATPSLSDVPVAGSNSPSSATSEMTPATGSGSGSGTGLGVEIVSPSSPAPTPGAIPIGTNNGSGAASSLPAATGVPDPNFGFKAPASATATSALPPVEKPAEAPDQINDAAGTAQAAAQVKDPSSKKKPKAAAVDKNDESSSKKKPKKGIDKINPF